MHTGNTGSHVSDFCVFHFQLAFRSVQQNIQELHGKLRHLLNLPVIAPTDQSPDDAVALEMEKHVEDYLSKCFDRFDVSPCIEVWLFISGHFSGLA